VTQRLYYHDCYRREFTARVVEIADGGLRAYLDCTAFYPTSGGQPSDLGTLSGIEVREVVDQEDRIAHLLKAPLAPDIEVSGHIDWARRFDHMQQHTGQHLLSAVLVELFDIPTLSFHMGAAASTIELGASAMDSSHIERVEERCAEITAQARPVSITFEDASSDLGLRKASQRVGTLRIVSIEGLDHSACGGTHVRSTAEAAPILIRKTEKSRGNVRIEFVCGARARRQARRDFQTLTGIGRSLSVPFEETPALVAAQIDKTKALEKTCQRLATELAQREGRELYAATPPGASGLRRTLQRGPIDDAMRARAQAFVAGGKAVFLAICDEPCSLLMAASSDSGIHAGDKIKAAGARGGGSQTLAQGSVPDSPTLEAVIRALC